MKQSPVKSSSVKPTGLQFGGWKASVDGEKITLANSADGKSQVQLQNDGFVYLNCATDEALEVDGLSGKVKRRQMNPQEWNKLQGFVFISPVNIRAYETLTMCFV